MPDYSLEHFYYGQLIVEGRPQGDLQMLACSHGVTPERAAEAMAETRIPPMPENGTPSIALLRGKAGAFYWVQAQNLYSGAGLRHVVMMPPDVLQALGGNLTALTPLILAQMPIFTEDGGVLPAVALPQVGIPTNEMQENAMLALMSATRDRMDVIESLLAAIVKGVPVYVKTAPLDLPKRLSFIEGLLALLPPPARHGVTFATHVTPNTAIEVQIRFGDDDDAPGKTLIYHWREARITGEKVQDEYSRFIKSQLRLDTHLVIQQTKALTAVAGWRIRRGETLAEALKYASYRLKIDNALTNNLPVNTPEVAKVLGEDPTLTDELRTVYVSHLMAFALAMDEVEHSDLLAVAVRGQPDLERVILAQMNNALTQGKADRVYKRLARWMANPIGFKGMFWLDLLHRAAVAYAEMLAAAGGAERLNAFLHHVRSARPELQTNAIIPQLIQIAMPLGAHNQTLALTLFAMGAAALPPDRWQRFIAMRALDVLPKNVVRLLAIVNGEDTEAVPAGLLARVASAFGTEWRALLFIRLGEAAAALGRYALLDEQALVGIAGASASVWADSYDDSLKRIVRALSVDELLLPLGTTGSRSLVQILLARRAYEELANELLRHGRLLYNAEKQLDYAQMLYTLFAETAFPLEEVSASLKVLSAKGIKPLPLAMAYFGALDQQKWSPTLDGVVKELAALVLSNRLIVEAIQPDLLLKLMDYFVQVRDGSYVARVAGLLPVAAARRGEAGVEPLLTMYQALNWDEAVRAAANDALRRYIRRLNEGQARAAVGRFGAELGKEVRRSLEATFLMRRLMGGEALADYAYSIRVVSQFIYDLGVAYADKTRLPTIGSLMSDLESLNGGLTDDERRTIAEESLELGGLLIQLSEQHRLRQPKDNDDQIAALIAGKGGAQTVLEVFRVMGGYFSQSKRYGSKLERVAELHPLGDRAVHLLVRELQQINRLLRTALRSLPPSATSDKGPIFTLGADVIRHEIESLWNDIGIVERRELVTRLAVDLQRIPELMLGMTEKIDGRVLQETNSTGKRLDAARQRPDNPIEFLRFVYGYFKGRAAPDNG